MDVSYKTTESVKSYFEGKDPLPGRKLVDVKALSGGLCNFLYRLYFDDATTAILKYFGKNVAFNEAAVDQTRYFIEKCSLSSFGERSISSKLKIPKLIYSDDKAFLLIMEDAGVNAKPLGMFLMKSQDDQSERIGPETIELLAEGIYEFLTFLKDKSNATENKELFDNKAMWEIIPKFYGDIFKSVMDKCSMQSELDTAHATKPDWMLKSALKSDSILVFGDFHLSSILFDSEKQIMWIIDWEGVRFGQPFQDLEQFMANLWVLSQSDSLKDPMQTALMKRIQFRFFNDENADWRVKCGAHAKHAFTWWMVCLLGFPHWNIQDLPRAIRTGLDELNKLEN